MSLCDVLPDLFLYLSNLILHLSKENSIFLSNSRYTLYITFIKIISSILSIRYDFYYFYFHFIMVALNDKQTVEKKTNLTSDFTVIKKNKNKIK